MPPRRAVPCVLLKYASALPDAVGLDLPHRIVSQSNDIRAGFLALADARSKSEFAAQIAWRCSIDYGVLPEHDPPGEMYFPTALYSLGADEVLVDCGAFDGDTIRMFRQRTADRFVHVYACEPDPRNREALDEFLSGLPAGTRHRVTVMPFAIGDRKGPVGFDASGTVRSRVTGQAWDGPVEGRRLDDLFAETSPTIVKMDIEGGEPAAIAGAESMIRRARPVVAVSAYHKCEHLWTLPVQMQQVLPDYRLVLRRYAEECLEAVHCEAPPERSIDSRIM